MKKQNPRPQVRKRNFTDDIEEWMIGQPSSQDDAAKKKSRIRKGKTAITNTENHLER